MQRNLSVLVYFYALLPVFLLPLRTLSQIKKTCNPNGLQVFFVYQCFAGFPESQNAAIIFNFLQASLPAVKAARISPGGSYYFSHDFFSMSISAAIPGNSFFSASNLATATAALLAAESFRFRLHACAPGPAACGTGGVGVIAGSC